MTESDQSQLAVCQGGNDDIRSSSLLDSVQNMGSSTISSASCEANQIAASLQSLTQTMEIVQRDLAQIKRKSSEQSDSPSSKQSRLSEDNDTNESRLDKELLIDDYLTECVAEAQPGVTADWMDINDFFEESNETGDEISSELADLANTVLRGKVKEDRAKLLLAKHRRPSNVENLQIPRVEEILWRQLQQHTKVFDFAMQKTQTSVCQALVPVLKMMQQLKREKVSDELKELVGDTFKILTHAVVQSNDTRIERIGKDLLPSYRPLCKNKPSATKLFGDKLQADIQALKETSTTLTTNKKSTPFFIQTGRGHEISTPRSEQDKQGTNSFPSQHQVKQTPISLSEEPSGQEQQSDQAIITFDRSYSAKDRGGPKPGSYCLPSVANSNVVANFDQSDSRTVLSTSKSETNTKIRTQTRTTISSHKNKIDCFRYIREALRRRGISQNAQELIISSWREGTKKQYETYIRQWLYHCKWKSNPFKPNTQEIINFLTDLHSRGLSYTAINTARSAISTFVKITAEVDIHSNVLISRFMKGIFNARPSLPRYAGIWDVRIVLNYLEHLDTSSLLALSCKLAMLFLLVTAQRCQTLHVLKLSDITVTDKSILINISTVLKQTRPGLHQRAITLPEYSANTKLCIVKVIKEYMIRTQYLRNTKNFLITTIKPHKAASKQTISRWIKLTMRKAGISDTFKPHSTRAASSSFAYKKGVPLQEILKTAGWSNANTFAKFYHKDITVSTNNYQENILSDS